jgi:hypothetical protein
MSLKEFTGLEEDVAVDNVMVRKTSETKTASNEVC